jgi:hypothetical protein
MEGCKAYEEGPEMTSFCNDGLITPISDTSASFNSDVALIIEGLAEA